MRISDWSSDVCSSDLQPAPAADRLRQDAVGGAALGQDGRAIQQVDIDLPAQPAATAAAADGQHAGIQRGLAVDRGPASFAAARSEERPVGRGGGSTVRLRGTTGVTKKKKQKQR